MKAYLWDGRWKCRQCAIGVKPAAPEILEIKIEGSTTDADRLAAPGFELLPVDPLPVDPLPVDPLPVDPLPVDPLPVDPLPVVLVVWVTPLVVIAVDRELDDRQDGHTISGKAPAVIRTSCASLSRSAAKAAPAMNGMAARAKSSFFIYPSSNADDHALYRNGQSVSRSKGSVDSSRLGEQTHR
jgi:hypothetical protein